MKCHKENYFKCESIEGYAFDYDVDEKKFEGLVEYLNKKYGNIINIEEISNDNTNNSTK